AAYEDLDAPLGWLATTHGQKAPAANRWVTRDRAGNWLAYLDLGVPEVRVHAVDVAIDNASNYPVDAIHLDYVRYPSHDAGYHPRALDRYRADTGATGDPAPTDPAFSAWRRDQARGTIAAASEALRTTAPHVTLSAAVISWGAGPGAP